MKIGILGPIGGFIFAALIIGAFVYFTPTDSPWRWAGFLLGAIVFAGCVKLAQDAEDKPFN